MNTEKLLRFLLIVLCAALISGAFYFLFPALLPFLLGWGLCCLLEPAVTFLCAKLRLRRAWAAAAVLPAFLLLLAAGGFFLVRRLWFELAALSAKFPLWMQLLQSLRQSVDNLIYRWTVAVSPQFRSALQNALAGVIGQLTDLLASLGASLLERLVGGVLSLPKLALFVFTALLSAYFILAGRPELTAFVQKQLPPHRLAGLKKTAGQLKAALSGWLKAQGILMAITFSLLNAGFLLMGVDAALLLAAGTALLDALPMFGTGTVLLPWSLFCALKGELRRALSLAVLYALLWLTRSLLEPKLIANRAGLHPLAALLAMYAGFSLFGVAGLILAPLGAVLAARLYESGVLRFRQKR